MIISLSGAPGSGKSTVGKMLAERMGYKRYYIGALRREAARKRGMTLEEYNKLGEADPSTDKEVDYYQEELGRKEDNFIIEGRTSFHFIPHSIKIYLDVSPEEGARRVFSSDEGEQRNENILSSVQETQENLERRVLSDKKRYLQYYGFDHTDRQHYDLLIDTTEMTPEQVVEGIIAYLHKQENV